MDGLAMLLLIALAYPFVAAWLVGLRRTSRIEALEQQVAALRDQLQQIYQPLPVTPTPRPVKAAVPKPAPQAPDPSAVRAPPPTPHRVEKSPGETPPKRAILPEPAPAPPPRWLIAAKTWVMTGNPVAKLGLVILFIGIAFLLKYVAATVTIPIELRLAAVVLADLGLLAWGWRLRLKRREIGLPVQGTAIAILMLVIFSASQRYDLIPTGLAFGVLVSLMIFTCLLAVLQEAPWLAAFGITGGFACPVLLSTGHGSHIALFSYYAMLNAGVFALAVKRSWHQLNLLGFVFTFGVAGVWGGLRYTPEHYWSAQAFLILFFLCYSAIPLVFAGRKTTRLQDYVDVLLVMGTPLLTFGFQVGLVKDMSFGLAFSALGLGGFYLVVGTILWRVGKQRWRMLVKTFAVFGAIFGTLTIPFAFDARWTSAAWALEGFGFVWFGLQHRRRAIWVCGLLLQVAAWISFIPAVSRLDRDGALAAHIWLGFLLLAGSAYAIAVVMRKPGGDEQDLSPLADTALGLAAAWLLAGCWTEAALRLSGGALANWLVAGAMFTGILMFAVSRRMAWPLARQLVLAAQIAGAIGLIVVGAPGLSLTSMIDAQSDTPLPGLVMLAVAALATSRTLHRAKPAEETSQLASTMLLSSVIWWICAMNIVASRAVDYVPDALGSDYSRWLALYTLGIVSTSIACVRYAPRLAWPQLRWIALATWGALGFITLHTLVRLYGAHMMPDAAVWIAWAIAWAGSEQAMLRWGTAGSTLNQATLKLLHTVRTGGPWLALWPTGAILIDRWLATPTDSMLTGQDSWVWDAAWSNYLPTWAMMLAIIVLLRRSMSSGWPTVPVPEWYRTTLVPVGTLLLMLPVALWNLGHDGAMAPLPYLPLLNPLDLTTGFVLMLSVRASHQLDDSALPHPQRRHKLKVAGVLAVWLWLNLMLLRSAAHYLDLDYRLADLAASNAVQALLSLVWSASACVLMRVAARKAARRIWWGGALLLGIVVAKLFLIDLASGGSIARVVSFVGVGLLLLLVGYLAPYPKTARGAATAAPA
jgi:uncharacterized membrane protein